MSFAYINDQFVDEDKATIGISDLSIRRGFGIFDFFRTSGLKPLFMDNHLDRFYASAVKVGLVLPYEKSRLKDICTELVLKNNIEGGGVRIILTGGYSDNSYTPTKPNLIITNEPLKLVDEETRSRGVKVISYDYQREFPEVKTINYFTGIMMQKKAHEVGGFDVLYHNGGQLREFTRSNIFIVTKDGEVATPASKILKGVTRGSVIDLAKKKYQVRERDVTMNELFAAKEVFMTGTTKRVLPIVRIDEHVIGDGKPGEITMEIFKDFYAFEKSQG